MEAFARGRAIGKLGLVTYLLKCMGQDENQIEKVRAALAGPKKSLGVR